MRFGLAFAVVLLVAAIAPPAHASGRGWTLSSPDHQITVTFKLDAGGRPLYSVAHHRRPLLDDSALGLELQDADPLDRGFVVTSAHNRRHDDTWHPVWGEYATIRNRYNELVVDLSEKARPRRRLTLIFRAYDDGVAFRYVIPRQRHLSDFAITDETTEFRFAGDFTATWIPAEYGPGSGDEHLWRRTPLSQIEPANTPLTIQTPDRGTVTLHEADLIDYASMTAAPQAPGGTTLRSALVPMPDGVKVRGTAPHKSPWRTLTIGDEPKDLIESTLILNLNPPCAICDDDTSWIRPGKYVGVWWEIHKGLSTWEIGPNHGATTENAKRYIDFAARHGIPYVLTEGWNKGWGAPPQDFLTPMDDFNLEDVVAYAKSKGVDWLAHNESEGNVDNYLSQIDAAYSLYEGLGVPGVKTGYAGSITLDGGPHNHYDQAMVNHYRDTIQRAAKHHLMVEAHEIIKDTGERRTYPNIMTREAVRGQEWEAWSEGNPPEHAVNLPFTRNVAGPMSYTPGIFDVTWDPGGPGRPPWRTLEHTRVHTTRAKQLAMYPVFLSGLQMLADVPEHYEGQPDFEFLEHVPTTWDDTKAINGQIGDYVTVARRSGREWYVGSMTDEQPRTLEIPLRFLSPHTQYVAHIYGDAPETDLETNPNQVKITRVVVDRDDTLTAAMKAGSGQAIRLVPATSG
jgi:alpha-glucosidase